MKPMTVWYAEMGTRHFTFRALGQTRQEALEAIRRALRAHTRQYGPNQLLEYAGEGEEAGDVNLLEMACGAGYRDWEPVATRKKEHAA